jgi:hypothetical protein
MGVQRARRTEFCSAQRGGVALALQLHRLWQLAACTVVRQLTSPPGRAAALGGCCPPAHDGTRSRSCAMAMAMAGRSAVRLRLSELRDGAVPPGAEVVVATDSSARQALPAMASRMSMSNVPLPRAFPVDTPVRYTTLPLDCHCDAGVDSQC